jgi:hypothetical protein
VFYFTGIYLWTSKFKNVDLIKMFLHISGSLLLCCRGR